MTSIPSHLQYKPPKVRNDFQYVESRYMSPTKRVDPNAQLGDRLAASRLPSPPRSREYQGVSSRYLSPKTTRVPREEAPVQQSPDMMNHKKYAASQGITATSSKFFDVHLRPTPTSTRRSEVEEKKRREADHVKKDGQSFRIKHVKEQSFKAMERSNRELQERWNSPTKRSNNAHSVVMSFVNNGVPIPGYDAGAPKRPTPEPKMGQTAFLSGGGAGGGTFFRRTNSPTKVQTSVQEKKVERLSSNLRSARTSSPPRVAALENRQAKVRREESCRTPQPNMSLRTTSPSRAVRQTRSPSPTQRTTSPTKYRSDSPTRTAPAARTSYYKRDTTLFDTQPPRISAFR